jgi:[ribosomal protein S5]-alanine N-acetyltransferase
MNHQGTNVIKTPRLLLRQLSFSDADAMFFGWANDLEVTRYLSWKPHGSVEETKRIISFWMSNYADPKFYLWGIQLQSGQLIGTISIHTIQDTFLRGEIGYALAKKYWNKGYVTEAARAVIDYAFSMIGFNRIEAHHSLDNASSGKVMEKCGMQYEGNLRQYYKSNRGFEDSKIYSILRKDWEISRL